MAENISVDIGVNSQHLEQALRKIEDVFNKGTSELGGGAGGKAQISELRRLIQSLVNQQNIYLRAAERSGRVHSSRMAEQERYFEGVAQNIRLRAQLREQGGSTGGTPISNMLGGGSSPREMFHGFEKKISEAMKDVYKYQTAQEDIKENQPQQGSASPGHPGFGGAKGGPLGGLPESKKMASAAEKMGKITGGINQKLGGFIKKGGDFMKTPAGKGVMAGGMAGAGIITMVIKKAIEASPMLQSMLKIVNTALLLWLRPIGDFFGFALRPLAMYMLKASAAGLSGIKYFQKLGAQVGDKILAFFLNPGKFIALALEAPFKQILNPNWFTEQIKIIIDDANAKLGGAFSKDLTRFQAQVSGAGTGYTMEVPAELQGLLAGMEQRYGQHTQQIESWLSKAVPIFEEFAIVVPEEMLGAWDYYMRQVDAGGMTLNKALGRMKADISRMTTEGKGIYAGVLVYTKEIQKTIIDFRDKLQSIENDFVEVSGGYVVNMDGSLTGIVTGTETVGATFIETFGTALDDIAATTKTTTQQNQITLIDAANELGKMWDAWFKPFDESVASTSTGQGGAHAHAQKVIADAISGASSTGDVKDAVVQAATEAGASAEVIGLAKDFLTGKVDMTKYFGPGAHYGDIGGTFGYNYDNISANQITNQMGLSGGNTGEAAANKILNDLKQDPTTKFGQAMNNQNQGKVANAMLSIAQAGDTPAKKLAALAKLVGANTGGVPNADAVAEYKALVATGMPASQAIAVSMGTSGAVSGNTGTTSSSNTSSTTSSTGPSGGPKGGGKGGNTGGRGPGGKGPGGGKGGGSTSSGGASKGASKSGGKGASKGRRGKQLGGWITEEILGVGLDSGVQYAFGEGGVDEYVTPSHRMSDTSDGGITINFYIEKIAKEVDMEDLQRKISAAILEVHSRRVII